MRRATASLLRALGPALIAASAPGPCPAADDPARRPNVVLILTDDQGFGDLGRHGNPVLRTPHLDRLASESVAVRAFYVAPVCAPTRASLLTGRYNYRTRVTDTYLGRALMDPDEVTLAEMLRDAGYRTGIFGKWHLGDNLPMRPIDQGFDEALVHRGGGLGQPSDSPEPGGSSYTDPILRHNGREVKTTGYCSDVFTDAALRFLEADPGRPFFAYLAFNAPHTPLEVPESYRALYDGSDLSPSALPAVGRPIEGRVDSEATARVYGMVTNLDDNVGRLLARLDELALARETIVIFLTDNGPQQPRYNAGLRGLKGSVYEGGIRVPFLVRWPGRLEPGREVDVVGAHIDVVPTLLEACGVPRPEGVALDGLSLLPWLEGRETVPPDRTLFFQWHRGDVPRPGRAFAAREARWKLVQPLGAQDGPVPDDPPLELYDLRDDPFEQRDLAARHPEVVRRLRAEYARWFADVCGTRGFDPPPIVLGSDRENPSVLTRQDWRGGRAGWSPTSLGHWSVEVARPGTYRVALRFDPPRGAATVRLSFGGATHEARVAAGSVRHTFEALSPTPGRGRLEASVSADDGGMPVGVRYAEVERLEER